MIEYIRRYLNDPENVASFVPLVESGNTTSENSLTSYFRRYLGDPI